MRFYGKIFSILAVFGVVFWGSVMLSNRVFSYSDTVTHPSLTENITKAYNANFERKLSGQEIGWLRQGSIEEDVAPRWMSHFYEPNTGSGIWGFSSSKDWAQSPLEQSLLPPLGDQTWQKALDAYVKGDEKSAFVALGHTLHLLEDATVPAHTRLDPHPEGDPYESWVFNKIGSAIDFNVSSVAISGLNEAFDGLAGYSSRYFLSKDTVDEKKLSSSEKFNKWFDGKMYRCVRGSESQCLILVKIDVSGESYYLDNPVHSDYFSLLGSKAVSYGAGVVKLFFEEAERKKQAEQQKSWWEKLKDKVNNLLSGIPGPLYAGFILPGGSQNLAPSPAVRGEAPEQVAQQAASSASLSSPASTKLTITRPVNATLPPNTVVALQNGKTEAPGNITEQISPQNAEIPSLIIEEKNPSQAVLPSPSVSPVPTVTPSPTPTSTPVPLNVGGSGSFNSNSSNFSSDTTSPETTITSQPQNPVASTTAIFVFNSSESGSTFECQLDNSVWSVCDSFKEYGGLAEGSHIFQVRATDAAGHQDSTPAQGDWTVDLSPPQISNIFSAAGRTSAVISWSSSESGIFQIEYGTTTSYGLASATTSLSSTTIGSLVANTAYHFRLLARDSAGNATSSGGSIFTTVSQAENVVISEIQIAGATANDEFVELYNPTSSDINLSGWKLAKRSFSATSSYANLLSSFPDKIIPAKGYFLIAHPTGYDGGVPADAVYSSASYYIAADNAVILYSDTGHTIVDLVGLGAAASFKTVTIGNPSPHQSIDRKAVATSTAELLVNGAHQWQGNGYDSENNSSDFVLQPNPNPQNSLMLIEPRGELPNLMTSSSWPTWQQNMARTGLAAANVLASTTLAVKWTATTTATHDFISRPALDDQGDIYIGRVDGLAKYSSSGSLLWFYASSTAYSTPLLTSDGTIFFRCAWALCVISQDGQFKWQYFLSGSAGQNAALAILSDGAIVTQSSEKVYAINQDATVKWIFDPGRTIQNAGSISAPVIDSSDNIYIAIDHYFYAISAGGVLLWERDFGNAVFLSSLALSGDNLYFSATDGLYALNKVNGSIVWSSLRWQTPEGYNDHAELAPAINSDGNVYFISFHYNGSTTLVAHSTSTPLWLNEAFGGSFLAAPVITADGKIYLANANELMVFDALSGSFLFNFASPDNGRFYTYFGAVGGDGTVYTADSLRLYAIGN